MLKKFFLLVSAALLLLRLFPALAGEIRPVLTIGDTIDRSGARVNGADQLGMWRYLEDQIGMEIQYVYVTQAEYASMMNSGNLPDILITSNNLSEIREKGLALNIDPYLEEYAPNLLRGDVGLAYRVIRQINGDEDGFWFIPEQIGINGAGYHNQPYNRGFVVRWDYYKELGYPPITTEDDYLNVLRQMYKNHPYTEEGYPTYLFGMDNHTGYATAFRAGVSLDYWAAFKYQNNIFTNEIYDGYTDPEHSMWWTSMAWLNKLYRAGKEDGSFDLDLFTQSSTQYSAKRTRGQYLGLPGINGSLYTEKRKMDADTLSGYCFVPTDGVNLYTNVYQLLGNGSAYMWFISANSPHKEEALRLFNYMCDPDYLREAFLGRRGVTWDYGEDGVPRMNEYGQAQLDAFKAGSTDPENYYTNWGSFNSFPNNWPILRDNLTHPDGYPLDFVTLTREYGVRTMTNNIARDVCAQYGAELPQDTFYQAGGMDFRNDCGEAISASISSLSSDRLHIISEAEEILEYVRVDLILAESDEEFAAIQEDTIQRLIDLGESEVFETYRQKWDAAAAIIVPMVLQIQAENGIEPYTPEQYR